MGDTFRTICFFFAVVACLSFLTACGDDGEEEIGYYLKYEPSPDIPPRRPGTTGVRIMPPKKEPLRFELHHGSSLNIGSLMMEFPGDELTAEFTVPCDGGKVRDLKVTYLDHRGAADRVKSVISSWVYSATMCGKMTIVIKLSNANVQVDTSELRRNGEIKPLMGALYND